MKQVIFLKRTEFLKVELEVIQPLARATIEALYNNPSLGLPRQDRILQQEVTPYVVQQAQPSCECATAVSKKRKGK